MLSIGSPKTPQPAQEYLLQYDPYFGHGNATWFGRAAEALGLTGRVDHKAFQHLLVGSNPGGDRLVRAGGPRLIRIAGFDLAFSAPKSCSLVSLYDPRVVNAHSGAVRKALAYAEDRYAQARAMAGGKQIVVETGNLAGALFVHMTSRALDPHLHTHAFVLNITRRLEDGRWRALHRGKQVTTGQGATRVLSNPFYSHRLLLGQIYQNELSRDLALAGYRIRVTDLETGLWELARVPETLTQAFSKRRTEIERQAREYQRTH
ncbi:MAG: MobF family relaxase, partial [bacterium]